MYKKIVGFFNLNMTSQLGQLHFFCFVMLIRIFVRNYSKLLLVRKLEILIFCLNFRQHYKTEDITHWIGLLIAYYSDEFWYM